MIKIKQQKINDCFVSTPSIYSDNRGEFSELYKYSGIEFKTKQINYSRSKKGVFRGIHRTPYAKFVTCVHGSVYDICLDLRENSSTYKQHIGIELNSKVLNSLYIPSYCGHGFLALEDSILIYLQDDEYLSSKDETYCYKKFNIHLPFDPFIISNKDNAACDD